MKTKKLIALLACGTMTASILAGCGSSSTSTSTDSGSSESSSASVSSEASTSEDTFTVGFSNASLDYPYYVTMQEGLEAACEAKGWNLITVDSGNDAEKALNDCNDMILEGIDALVITSWYGDTLSEVFDTCEEKDIPVFLIDTGTVDTEETYVTEIGTDSYQAGYYGGLWTAKYLEEQGLTDINLLNFYNETEISALRVEGFVAGLEEVLPVNVLNEYLDSTREGYMSSCEDALVTYDDVDLIYGASALAGLGAYDACDAAERTEIYIVGFDAEDEEIEKIDAGTNYIASIMQLPAVMAEETVEMIDGYVNNGETYDKHVDCESGVYSVDGELTITDIESL